MENSWVDPEPVPCEDAADSQGEKARAAHIIVNPAAGQDEPFLKTLNTTFKEAGWEYEVLVTQKAGDARQFAVEAVQKGAALVATYGGDGTVIEAASGLVGTSVPLGILPGGTGNMMSKALGIPQTFAEACALLVSDEKSCRAVHMGDIRTGTEAKDLSGSPATRQDRGPAAEQAQDQPEAAVDQPGSEFSFFQLIGVGLEAKMVEGADRDAKDRMGILAYGMAALQALAQPVISRYRLELDGDLVETEGVTCMVAIVENLGISGLAEALSCENHPDELDVMVLNKINLQSFVELLGTMRGKQPTIETIEHWHARRVKITAEPPQVAQADGELLGNTPIEVEMVPEPVLIIVPKDAPATTEAQADE